MGNEGAGALTGEKPPGAWAGVVSAEGTLDAAPAGSLRELRSSFMSGLSLMSAAPGAHHQAITLE
ncbi:Hypothetical protein CAP_3866 [Chondromyces apiculatus DSM 436]|uniref:Uncharacterized protein n=1 Tax=Chondromyces apiculatus DSM 436 TaxID=1192034 RepID=A0A017T7Q3_9BACT|nr:Hypothetical protein CAP_3866 [Chondromyces apiculatus DSM 436]